MANKHQLMSLLSSYSGILFLLCSAWWHFLLDDEAAIKMLKGQCVCHLFHEKFSDPLSKKGFTFFSY